VGRRILPRLFFLERRTSPPKTRCSRDATGTEDSPDTHTYINCVKLTVVIIDRYRTRGLYNVEKKSVAQDNNIFIKYNNIYRVGYPTPHSVTAHNVSMYNSALLYIVL